MKPNFKISNIYATVLYNYANKLQQAKLVYYDMKKVEKILLKIPNIQYYILNNPLIKINTKLDLIYKYFNFSCNLSKDFYKIVFLKKREFFLLNISIEYQKIYECAKNIVRLKIISAIPLPHFFYKKIIHFVKKNNKNARYNILNVVDKKLLGGVCLYIEDKKWDFSVKNHLIKIKENFS